MLFQELFPRFIIVHLPSFIWQVLTKIIVLREWRRIFKDFCSFKIILLLLFHCSVQLLLKAVIITGPKVIPEESTVGIYSGDSTVGIYSGGLGCLIIKYKGPQIPTVHLLLTLLGTSWKGQNIRHALVLPQLSVTYTEQILH